ncbi:LTA synthase family protein [Companilactobacillus sp. DQM5]|uniref:LTA synthase family protein n=1 Tax=Companilactobacillus sp. DQM5 TaxID=3463359 RepID=UPI00405A4607
MKRKKIPSLPLIIAGILLILNQLLNIPSITKTDHSDYIIYTIIKGISILGMNLIPLYLGFNYIYFKKTIHKVSKYIIIYFSVALLTNIVNFFLCENNTLKYFWTTLFPISQNSYPYGLSIILIFISMPIIINFLQKISNHQLKQILLISTYLFVIAPTLFGKDIWSIQAGGMILFNTYLVLLGYSINRLKFINTNLILTKSFISISVYSLSTFLMFLISKNTHNDLSTINRFNVSNSFFAVYASIYLFILLNKKLKLSSDFTSNFLIISTLITMLPSNINQINNIFSENSNDNIWLLCFRIFLTLIIISLILTTIFTWLEHTALFTSINQKLQFNSIDDFFINVSKFKQILLKNKRLLIVMASFYVITLIQMGLVALAANHGTIFELFLNYQAAIFLSTFILTAFFLLMYLLTNRFWYVYGFIFIIELLLTISTFLKIQLRHEPVLPTDMSALKSANDILNMIDPIIIILGIIIMVIFVIFTFTLQLKYQKKYQIKLNFKKRIISIVLLTTSLFGLLFINHAQSVPSKVFDLFNIQKKFFNQENGARINGPFLQFINNLDVSVMKKPSGYSKKNIHKIMNKYDVRAASINKTRKEWQKNQTFIFVLSESFSDPSRVPNLKLDNTPISNILNAKKLNSSGLMLSSGYGGGTANMEWQSLTGLDLSALSPTLPTPYSQLVDNINYSPNITNLFDEKIAIHPYNASLYNRKDVFKDFGFQHFYHQGSTDKLKYTDKIPASPYISDESAYKETERLISSNNSKSQFIQLSTMQNHLPFDKKSYSKTINISGSAIGNNKDAIDNYIQRIQYTDTATKSFLDYLDSLDRPITLVWYGDHLPGIYSGDSMSKYAVSLHQTDYFIFNNKSAKNNIRFNKLISPYSFSSLALKQANIKVTPYYAMLTDITESLPASMNDPYTTVKNTYNGAQVFINDKNKIIKYSQLSKNQKQLLKDYKLIQYDIVSGKQYSAKWAMQKSY